MKWLLEKAAELVVVHSFLLKFNFAQIECMHERQDLVCSSNHEPVGSKKKYFATQQEACRKDVERAFGVLQSRFAIVKGPVFGKKMCYMT